jgi:hypothetical protein
MKQELSRMPPLLATSLVEQSRWRSRRNEYLDGAHWQDAMAVGRRRRRVVGVMIIFDGFVRILCP